MEIGEVRLGERRCRLSFRSGVCVRVYLGDMGGSIDVLPCHRWRLSELFQGKSDERLVYNLATRNRSRRLEVQVHDGVRCFVPFLLLMFDRSSSDEQVRCWRQAEAKPR